MEYTVYKSAYYYSAPDEAPYDYYQYGEEESYGGYGEVLSEGKVRTDANGHAVVQVKAPNSGQDERITLRATAKDVTERIVTSENDAFVVGGDFYFRTRKTEYFAVAGSVFPLTVVTRSYDGQPVKVDYKIEVEREKWNDLISEYQYKKFDSVKGTTGENGTGSSEIQVKEGGYYRLALSGKDKAGRKVVFYDYLWVSGSAKDSEDFGLQKSLVVVPEKKKYEAGETVHLFVAGPIKDGKILVTVEGTKIHDYRVETLSGFSKLVQIPLKKDWIPNVFINVSAIGEKELYEEFVEIAINPAEHYLNVAVEPNQNRYEPGNDISYRIFSKDSSGKPVPAEVSLGVVDESLYALRKDHTNIKEFFWGPKPNRVGSNYSFSGYYSGGIEKEDQKLLRRNFKDTAYWSPAVMTNEQGEATVSFKLPDNLTTWRATAIAATAQTEVGQELDKVISTKPLITRIAIPRFFTERDEAVLKAIVQNYTTTPQTLKVSLGLSGLQFKNAQDEAPRTVTVEPNKTVSFNFPVLAKTPGEAKVQLLAKNDAVSDGFELKIPILPHGIEDHQYAQGEITAAAPGGTTKAAVNLNILPQTNLGNVQLKVSLDTTMMAQLLDSLAYLVAYPYGCVEQTTSRLLSSITVAHLYQTLGIKDEAMDKKVPKIVSKSLKKLANMQHAEGGWGWWKNDETNPFMTAYAMYGLLRVQELGFKVNEEMVKKGKESLDKQIQGGFASNYYPYGPPEDTQYFIYYVASLAGLKVQPPMPDSKQLATNLSQAYLILTLAAQDRQAEIEPWLTHLERAAVCSGNLCHFSDTKNSHRGDSEVTAWALRALLTGGSFNETLKRDVVSWLLSERQGGIWVQTQQTAAAIYALSEYAKTLPGVQAGVKANLLLNGKELEKINVAAAHFVRKLKGLAVQLGKNAFEIINPQALSLYYETDLAYFSQEEDLAAVSQGIQIEREYFRIKMHEDPATGDRSYQAVPLQGKVALGEIIGVRLTLQHNDPLSYLVVEDSLPSGFEVMEDISFDKDAQYTTEREVHDERIALFRSHLDAGKQIFNYAIRPEIPGSFHVMPARSYEMYRPEVRGSSKEARLQVE